MKEEAQKYILEILTILHKRIPTKLKHGFQLGEDGRLWLWINIGKKWQSIIFDEEYEDIEPEKVVEELILSLKEGGYKIDL